MPAELNKTLAAIDDDIAPGSVFHVGGSDIRGRDGLRQSCAGTLVVFPNMQVSVDLMLTEDGLVAGRYTFHRTYCGAFVVPEHRFPPSGRPVTLTATTFSGIVAGPIVEDWDHQNLFGLLQQLGVDLSPSPETNPLYS